MRFPSARERDDDDLKYRRRKFAEDPGSGNITVAAIWLVFYLLAFAIAIWMLVGPDAPEVTADQHAIECSQVVSGAGHSPQLPACSHTAQIPH